MLYLIGIGIHDEKDISLKGIEAARKCSKVFAEFYTSPIPVDIPALEKIIGRKITVINRKHVEEENTVLSAAKKQDVAFLVGGDPLAATTHAELVLGARKAGVKTEIIHSSSIFSAVAETGMHLYKFGRTVSLPTPENNYFPLSPYGNILENKKSGLHTLLLLDIGMTANKAIEVLLGLEAKLKKKLFSKGTELVVCAHLGGDSTIKYNTMEKLQKIDFGAHPHCMVIPGELHFHETEFLETFK